MKRKILVVCPLPGSSENLLKEDFELSLLEQKKLSRDELIEAAQGQDAIVSILLNKIDEEFFKACPTIKLVANVAVGYDNIDMSAAKKRGILVCNTPHVLTNSTADLAFALMLCSARRLMEAERYLKEGKWQSFALDLLLGSDVHHKTLGIIGMGRIGQALSRRAQGFDMKVVYTNRQRLALDIEKELKVCYLPLNDLLSKADFVSLNCPFNENTRHLMGKEQFQLMKKSAFLINTARGAIVDERALIEALKSGEIKGAGLDVFENEPQVPDELKELPNVVVLPHIGSASIETRTAMGELAVNAVISAFNCELPPNAVNKESWPNFLKRAALEI
ncbi:MAG: D-glycerate dehydrogenase [Candidatus Obscuribacterales bacterium]|nr:D-glycerate dehydrogenase [Candidatus Obscuribacterales bacterium]